MLAHEGKIPVYLHLHLLQGNQQTSPGELVLEAGLLAAVEVRQPHEGQLYLVHPVFHGRQLVQRPLRVVFQIQKHSKPVFQKCHPFLTAERECRRYGQAMVECQRILYDSKKRVPADILEFPHMVMVGYKSKKGNGILYNCGGSLISSLWVLSAAHCLGDTRTGPPVRVRLGTTTLEDEELEEDIVQERNLVELIRHPNYKPPAKYNDIALLRMDRPIEKLGEHIRIACLLMSNMDAYKMARASGFGKTSFDNADGSLTMMHVELDIIPQDQCNNSLKSMTRGGLLKHGIISTQICAGDLVKGGKDTCQGDSGGPLQIYPKNPDCKETFPLYVLLGVTSFGRFCGFKNSPGVYTKVSMFVDWIEDIVWPRMEAVRPFEYQKRTNAFFDQDYNLNPSYMYWE